MSLLAALRARAADLVICALLVTAGATAGVIYNRTFIARGGQPQYYQRELAAAVMQACGRGFATVKNLQTNAPSLDAFLRQERPRLACSQIPAQVTTETPGIVARVSRYLFGGIAALWWLRGISWQALDPLFGFLFGASVVAAYALFRIAMPPSIAAICAIACLSSSAQFNNLPHLRDYAKAPFAIALISLAGWTASRSHSRRALLALSAGAGAVLGVGLGVRTDLMLFAVATPVAIVLAPRDKLPDIRARGLALGVFAVTFIVTAWPLLQTYAGGNNIWHVIVLGLMSPFDEPLGVSTPFYTLGHLYHDEYVNMAINSYAARALGNHDFLLLASKGYEQASLSYFKEVLLTMPADLVIRLYASILQILKLPFESTAAPPEYIGGRAIERLYAVRAQVLSWIGPLIPLLGLGALAVASATSVRLATFWLFAIALFAGMPALQYHQRHFFHLEVLGWFLLGAVLTQVYAWIRSRRTPTLLTRPESTRAALFVSVMALAVVGTLQAARAYQRDRMTALVRSILSAPATPVRTTTAENGWPGVNAADLPVNIGGAPERGQIRTAYLSVLVTPDCPYETVPVAIQYGPPLASLSTTMTASVRDDAQAATRMIFPVYEPLGPTRLQLTPALERIELRAPAACFGGMWQIEPTPDIRLLPFLTLDERWSAAEPFQSMRSESAGERLYVDPANALVPRSLRQAALQSALSDPVFVARPTVRSQKRWVVRGDAEQAHSYLLLGREEFRQRGAKLAAQGALDHGGFTLGLLRNGRWSSRVNVAAPGRFRIVLDVPDDGAYQVVLANNLPNSLHNSFVIDEIGWTVAAIK